MMTSVLPYPNDDDADSYHDRSPPAPKAPISAANSHPADHSRYSAEDHAESFEHRLAADQPITTVQLAQLEQFSADEAVLSSVNLDVRHATATADDTETDNDNDTDTDIDDDDDNDNDDDDHLFDSDEQVDVESLSLSDDDDDEHHHALVQSATRARPDAAPRLGSPHARMESPPPALTLQRATSESIPRSSRRAEASAASLLSRASQTFYKTFIKRKPSTADQASPSSSSTDALSAARHHMQKGAQGVALSDRNERLCRLLDAQLSALAGAKTGFVQLALLRPLAEETKRAVSQDARALLLEFGQLEQLAERKQRELTDVRSKGEEEVLRKERLLIEAKVALAEACGEVERLRGELASVKRTLAEPDRRQKGLRKRVEIVQRETVACQEARSSVENKLLERKRSLAREKADLTRLEKEYRDIEGDWA